MDSRAFGRVRGRFGVSTLFFESVDQRVQTLGQFTGHLVEVFFGDLAVSGGGLSTPVGSRRGSR